MTDRNYKSGSMLNKVVLATAGIVILSVLAGFWYVSAYMAAALKPVRHVRDLEKPIVLSVANFAKQDIQFAGLVFRPNSFLVDDQVAEQMHNLTLYQVRGKDDRAVSFNPDRLLPESKMGTHNIRAHQPMIKAWRIIEKMEGQDCKADFLATFRLPDEYLLLSIESRRNGQQVKIYLAPQTSETTYMAFTSTDVRRGKEDTAYYLCQSDSVRTPIETYLKLLTN